MGYVTTQDGVDIFYKDWGRATRVIFFHHGWPLSADDWDAQMLFFLGGYRVIAHVAAMGAPARSGTVMTWITTRTTSPRS